MVATSFEAKIFETIEQYVDGLEPLISKAYPNVSFNPSNNEYIEVNITPNGRAQITASGRDARQGILQLALISKLNDGIIKPRDVLGNIQEAHFPKGKRIFGSGLIITFTIGDIGSTTKESTYARTPLTIDYIAR